MSYICDKCGKATKNGAGCTVTPVSYREKDYINIVLKKANAKKKRYAYSFEKAEEMVAEGWEIVKKTFTKGKEIVSELKLCPECDKND